MLVAAFDDELQAALAVNLNVARRHLLWRAVYNDVGLAEQVFQDTSVHPVSDKMDRTYQRCPFQRRIVASQTK